MTIIIVAALLYLLGDYSQQYYDERDYTILIDYTRSLQMQITVVSTLEDGYIRTLNIPNYVQGKEINITNEETYISVTRGGKEYTLPIPNVQGTLTKGENIIKKNNDIICINC